MLWVTPYPKSAYNEITGDDHYHNGLGNVGRSEDDYSCAGVSISFWYARVSVPLLFAIGSRVG
jgi:hypothetical protein